MSNRINVTGASAKVGSANKNYSADIQKLHDQIKSEGLHREGIYLNYYLPNMKDRALAKEFLGELRLIAQSKATLLKEMRAFIKRPALCSKSTLEGFEEIHQGFLDSFDAFEAQFTEKVFAPVGKEIDQEILTASDKEVARINQVTEARQQRQAAAAQALAAQNKIYNAETVGNSLDQRQQLVMPKKKKLGFIKSLFNRLAKTKTAKPAPEINRANIIEEKASLVGARLRVSADMLKQNVDQTFAFLDKALGGMPNPHIMG